MAVVFQTDNGLRWGGGDAELKTVSRGNNLDTTKLTTKSHEGTMPCFWADNDMYRWGGGWGGGLLPTQPASFHSQDNCKTE